MVMTKTRRVNYRVGSPIATERLSVRTHLMIVFVPLLIVGAYCSAYIAFRIHQQQAATATISHNHAADTDTSASGLPITTLEIQADLTTVTMPTDPAPVSTSSHAASSRSLRSDDVVQYLQNSASNHGRSFSVEVKSLHSHK